MASRGLPKICGATVDRASRWNRSLGIRVGERQSTRTPQPPSLHHTAEAGASSRVSPDWNGVPAFAPVTRCYRCLVLSIGAPRSRYRSVFTEQCIRATSVRDNFKAFCQWEARRTPPKPALGARGRCAGQLPHSAASISAPLRLAPLGVGVRKHRQPPAAGSRIGRKRLVWRHDKWLTLQ